MLAGAHDSTTAGTHSSATPLHLSRRPFPVSFEPGQRVLIELTDGTRVEGIYIGGAFEPYERYRDRYDQWRGRSHDGARLPAWGDHVRFPDGGMTCVPGGQLYGFHPHGVEVRVSARGETRTAEWSQFHRMRGPGELRVDSAALRRLVHEGGIPWLSAMRLRVGEDEQVVPLDLVRAVRPPGGRGLEPVRREDLIVGGPTGEATLAGAVEVGFLRAEDTSLGLIGIRLFPSRFYLAGADAAVFLVHGEGGGFLSTDIALSGLIPLGHNLAVEPRLGPGAFIGSGGFVGVWNLGAGAIALGNGGLGVRVDYTRHQLMGSRVQETGLGTNSLMVGLSWRGQ
jgi:hypothetical protein